MFITFKKEENGVRGVCKFGLQTIQHEPDVDFERVLDRLKGV